MQTTLKRPPRSWEIDREESGEIQQREEDNLKPALHALAIWDFLHVLTPFDRLNSFQDIYQAVLQAS